MEQEQWKDIPGYEGFYQASTFGRVKSLSRTFPHNKGGFRHIKERILSPYLGPPYLMASLSRMGVISNFAVHQLVLLTFVGPCPEGMICRHFPDRDPFNCHLSNLSYGTYKQNSKDRAFHKTDCRGVNHPVTHLEDSKVLEIRQRYVQGATQTSLAKEMNLHQSTISQIVLRKTWTHI